MITANIKINNTSVKCDIKESLLWWQKKRLSYTTTGYGKKIPTSYMINYTNRWYRVYYCCYSNTGTAYIVSNKNKLIVNIYN